MRAGAWLAIFVVILALAGTAAWLVTDPRPAFSEEANSAFQQPGDPAKGQLIFAAGDCASCHASPGQPDRLRLGGGLALASPFGTFRVPNISTDRTDGIGAWRTIDLANALLSGVSPAGSHYYPAFPYPSYRKNAGWRRARPDGLLAYVAGRHGQAAAPRSGLALPHPAPDRLLEALVL